MDPRPDWRPENLTRALENLKRHGYTNTDLADRARTSRSQISRWLSGDHRPRYEAVATLAAAALKDYPTLECQSIVRDLCAAAGYPSIAIDLGIDQTKPRDEDLSPYAGQVWKLVRSLQARAREAGLNPGREEDVIEWALMVASDQARLAFDAALYRDRRG